MYTKKEFGKELKIKVCNKEDLISIAHWAYSLYLDKDVEDNLNDIFLALSTMEEGSEFEYSYEELEEIADRLIAGEDVKL